MKLLQVVMIILSSIVSIGMLLPTYAQVCYNCDESSTLNNGQQNQEKLTDKGGLMVGFYSDPASPTISNKTSLDLVFEDKNTRYPLSNVDYQVSILKGNDLVYQTPASHSTQGTAKVQYQFTEIGQYQVIVHVTGMNSKQIPQETASFPLLVGSSAVPEFPASTVLVFAIAIISIVVASTRTRIRISNVQSLPT